VDRLREVESEVVEPSVRVVEEAGRVVHCLLEQVGERYEHLASQDEVGRW
jgi:hypothetical protein